MAIKAQYFRIALLMACASTLGACTFWPYKKPTSFTPASTAVSCPSLGTQNLSEGDSRNLLEAFARACEVIHSDAFMDRMAERTFVERCIEGNPEISGADLVRLLRNEVPDHSIVVRKPPDAEALSEGNNRRIAIRNRRVDAWNDGPPRSGRLVDTLVHEWTHMFMKADGFPRFQDSGWSADPDDACYKGNLVSYESGRIAEEVYLLDNPTADPN